MNKPKTYPKIIAISNGIPIPYVTEDMLTEQAGHLICQEVMDEIEANLPGAENKQNATALQALLDAENANLSTANASLIAANASLDTANTSVTALTAELGTTKASLVSATADAEMWKAKAIEYGAKAADLKPAAIPGSEAENNDDDLTALDQLPHNKRADQLLG